MTAAARVRMNMTLTDAQALSRALFEAPPAATERLHDQLWLRTVLIEQRRRTRRAERAAFDARADLILQQLDPHASGDRGGDSTREGNRVGTVDAASPAEVAS